MEDHPRGPHAPGDQGPGQEAGRGAPADRGGLPFDEALGRLEDVLLAYPYDRALPDLPTILQQAEVDQAYLRADDRAIKVLHEAILARPLATPDAVARVMTEVELLTVEVRVLTERLEHAGADVDEVERATSRLARVRRRLDEIRRQI